MPHVFIVISSKSNNPYQLRTVSSHAVYQVPSHPGTHEAKVHCPAIPRDEIKLLVSKKPDSARVGGTAGTPLVGLFNKGGGRSGMLAPYPLRLWLICHPRYQLRSSAKWGVIKEESGSVRTPIFAIVLPNG